MKRKSGRRAGRWSAPGAAACGVCERDYYYDNSDDDDCSHDSYADQFPQILRHLSTPNSEFLQL